MVILGGGLCDFTCNGNHQIMNYRMHALRALLEYSEYLQLCYSSNNSQVFLWKRRTRTGINRRRWSKGGKEGVVWDMEGGEREVKKEAR